ncbi:GRAM domain-containing protein 4, partial [Branchiostoma belcheri]
MSVRYSVTHESTGPRMGSLEDSDHVEVIQTQSAGPQSPGKTSAQGSVESLPGSEREMYERQLEQLQEQLVAAMIENQNLEKVHTELKRERDKNQDLLRRIQDHEYSQEESPATPRYSTWSPGKTTIY